MVTKRDRCERKEKTGKKVGWKKSAIEFNAKDENVKERKIIKNMRKKLEVIWESHLSKKTNQEDENGETNIWSIVSLMEKGKPGKANSMLHQGIETPDGKLQFGGDAIKALKNYQEKLGDPEITEKKNIFQLKKRTLKMQNFSNV